MTSLISSMLTPAVMINVCALLLLSTVNRNSRITDRIRNLNMALACDRDDKSETKDNHMMQLELFMTRGRMIRDALFLNYSALMMFILSSIALFLGEIIDLPEEVSLLTTVAGFVFLAAYAGLLIKESAANFKTTEFDYLKALNAAREHEKTGRG